MDKQRCIWCGDDALYIDYHDNEWGRPLHDDNMLFEFLALESFQAGLSWITILRKRENFRKAFDNFNPQKVAKYNEQKIEKLLANSGIVRNKAKIKATIHNAKLFTEIQRSYGSFDKYIWQFVNNTPIINSWENTNQIPAVTDISIKMSKQLKNDGFKFLGPTTCYAFMQATGMVNDHLVSCFRYE